MDDKTVTEYIVNRAISCRTEDEFILAMNEDEAGFSFRQSEEIFRTVHSMLPPSLIVKKRKEYYDQEEGLGIGEANLAQGSDPRTQGNYQEVS